MLLVVVAKPMVAVSLSVIVVVWLAAAPPAMVTCPPVLSVAMAAPRIAVSEPSTSASFTMAKFADCVAPLSAPALNVASAGNV